MHRGIRKCIGRACIQAHIQNPDTGHSSLINARQYGCIIGDSVGVAYEHRVDQSCTGHSSRTETVICNGCRRGGNQSPVTIHVSLPGTMIDGIITGVQLAHQVSVVGRHAGVNYSQGKWVAGSYLPVPYHVDCRQMPFVCKVWIVDGKHFCFVLEVALDNAEILILGELLLGLN